MGENREEIWGAGGENLSVLLWRTSQVISLRIWHASCPTCYSRRAQMKLIFRPHAEPRARLPTFDHVQMRAHEPLNISPFVVGIVSDWKLLWKLFSRGSVDSNVWLLHS